MRGRAALRACGLVAMLMTAGAAGAAVGGQPGANPGVTPLSPGGQPTGPADLAPPVVTPAIAQAAWEAQRWREAANAYRVLARDNPDDGEFAFRLAYSLHASGQYRRAIKAHEAAAEFEGYRQTSLYNLGCAHAVLGENDEAFEALWQAMEEGFDDRALMESDQDLFSLHDDPRWRDLLRGRPGGGGGVTPGRGLERDLGFLLGEWEVLDDRGRRVGSLSTRLEHDGRAVVREYRGDDGATGTALVFYDGVEEALRQVTIDSRGVVLDMQGQAHRNQLDLEGEVHGARGERFLRRTLTRQTRDGDVEVQTRESEDEGRTWRTMETVRYRRFGIVPSRPWRTEPGASGGAGGRPEPYRAPGGERGSGAWWKPGTRAGK